MRRTFGIDVLACPRCGGRLRLAALLDQAHVIERILRHLGLPTDVPRPRPARAPPRPLGLHRRSVAAQNPLDDELDNDDYVGNMGGQAILGELEQLVLLAAIRLGEQAYAVAIREEIEVQTGLSFTRGTIYVTLDRLEQKGYLESWFGDPTPERGGKAKRFFRARGTAFRALKQRRAALEKMWSGLGPVFEKV